MPLGETFEHNKKTSTKSHFHLGWWDGRAAVEAGWAAPGCVCRCRSARRVVFAAGEGLSGAAPWPPHARAP